jgi:cell division protein FtsI (penicillin-binding protein 3)
MELVVEEGTAKAAKINGYTIAGKTGTAAKLEGGRYSHSEYNASFVGFVPSRSPAVTVLVVIDSPHGKGFYGGAVAAPIFKRVAEATLRYLGIPPNVDPSAKMLVARRQAPPDNAVVATSISVPEVAVTRAPALAEGIMPDLRGMSAREAVHLMAQLGMAARLFGDGLVVDQQIAPGTPVEQGVSCLLRLGRRLSASEEGPASR